MMHNLFRSLLLSSCFLTLPAFAVERPPYLDAQSWILVDYNSANVLAEHRADRPLPPASLTKLMTVYIIFEKLRTGELKLSDPVTISANAARARGSRMRFKPGNVTNVE